jgi:hypothetical protein
MIFNRLLPGYTSSISFYIILFTPVISLAHISLTYVAFKLTHDVDKRFVSKGDEIIYIIKLINPTSILLAPFSLHYVASERLFKDAKDDVDHQIIVSERKRVIIRKHLICAYRGNYSIGVDKVVIRDFFKFFKFNYNEIEQHKILVYPKLRELKSSLLRNVINESNESVISNTTQNQSVFTDIRKYQPGDPLNKIHWKLTAKTGNFISKDYSGQMTNKTKIFLDTYSLNLDSESSIVYEDYMVEGCVSLVHFFLENRIHTQLYYERFGINKTDGRSSKDFPEFYDKLAKLSFYKEQKFSKLIDDVLLLERDPCHVILMTQQITLPLVEKLVRLKYQNYEISIVVCDYNTMDIEGIESFGDNKCQFILTTSKIPIYYMQHDESSTRLGVS